MLKGSNRLAQVLVILFMEFTLYCTINCNFQKQNYIIKIHKSRIDKMFSKILYSIQATFY